MTREEQSVKMGKRLKALREETPLNGKKMSHEKLKEKLKEIYGVEISRDSLMNYEVSDVNHSKFGTNLKMNVEYLNCLSSFYGVSSLLDKGAAEGPRLPGRKKENLLYFRRVPYR